MTLKGKHDFGEIDGKRVTFVEKGTSESRMKFLKALLEHNGFNVLVEKETSTGDNDKQTFTIGVDDIVFNSTIWVYERRLFTFDNHIVNPAYWEQINNDTKPEYWEEMFAETKNS